jgi:beta-aspartyl-dipeptidase (metallo-type)
MACPRSDGSETARLTLHRIRGGRVVGLSDGRDEECPVDILTLASSTTSLILGEGARTADLRLEDCTVGDIDARDCLVFPALVDAHAHPTGGGGAGGPQTLARPILLEEFLRAGIGTVVGCLGNDTTVRSPAALISRTRALRLLGLNAFAMTGEIGSPPVTITGSTRGDLALIEEVRGVKAAIGELGAVASAERLRDLAAEVVRGSRTGAKKPLLHLHVGNDAACLGIVETAVAQLGVPGSMIVLTHVNWNEEVLQRSARLAQEHDVNLDVTATIRPDFFDGVVDPARALTWLLAELGGPDRVTMSSDAGGSHAAGDRLVPHRPMVLLDALRDALASTGSPSDVVATVTSNPARRLGLPSSRLAPGCPADLLIVPRDPARPITTLLAGQLVVDAGDVLRRDPLAETFLD